MTRRAEAMLPLLSCQGPVPDREHDLNQLEMLLIGRVPRWCRSAAAHRHEDTGLRAFPAGQSPWPTAEDDLTIQQARLVQTAHLPAASTLSHLQRDTRMWTEIGERVELICCSFHPQPNTSCASPCPEQQLFSHIWLIFI